jgi:hypothetical protein
MPKKIILQMYPLILDLASWGLASTSVDIGSPFSSTAGMAGSTSSTAVSAVVSASSTYYSTAKGIWASFFLSSFSFFLSDLSFFKIFLSDCSI